MELDVGERRTFLPEWCGGDVELEGEVKNLLVVYERAEAYFTPNIGGRTLARSPGNSFLEKEGDWVGPYKLLQQIGEGGFGVVWMAQQEKPISRKVAIKVIKAGMDSKEVVGRFDAERQALARMDHPNIARVIDAGITDTGRPYFAMDLVKGVAITEFCDSREMDANARLGLFGDVCAAINHAHQKGVIHRDIKPSNILVTLDGDKPMVKVIDFGISKATEGKLTERTLFTRIEAWVGTPVYMSPEQTGLGSLDIDTRCDIYALGVLLYELLTGVTPFDQATLVRAGVDEMRRIIREVEPPRPSARLTSLGSEEAEAVGAARKVSREQLRRFVASDLDWIVMKAIDKSRDRRYGTAAALADDIARFLADEPVTAKPPSAVYLFGKFSKRHRAALLVACGIAGLLVAAVAVSGWQALRATRAEALAGERLEEAVKERNAKAGALRDSEEVTRLLTEIFRRSDPSVDGRSVTVVDALEAASGKLEAELKTQPERLALLQGVLAGTYDALSLPEEALALREKVLETRRRMLGDGHPETLGAIRDVIVQAEKLGQFGRIRGLAEEELEFVRNHPGREKEEIFRALRSAASAALQTGDFERAMELKKEIVELKKLTFGELSHETKLAEWELFQFQKSLPSEADAQAPGEKSEVEKAEDALSAAVEEHGDNAPETFEAMEELAKSQSRNRMPDLALATQIRLLALVQDKFSPMADEALKVRWGVASIYWGAERRSEALEIYRQCVRLIAERDGEGAVSTADAENALLRQMFYTDQGEGYRARLREVSEKRLKVFGPEHPQTLRVQKDLMLSLYASFAESDLEQAVALGENVVSVVRESPDLMHPRTFSDVLTFLARCYCKAGRTEEAVELLKEGCPLARDDTWVNFLLANLQLWFHQEEDYGATRDWMIGWMGEKPRRRHFVDRIAWISCIAPLKDEEQGRVILENLARVEAERNSPDSPPESKMSTDQMANIRGLALYRTGNFLGALERFAEAERFLASERKYKALGGEGNNEHGMDFYKALTLFRLGRQSEAEEVFKKAEEALMPTPSVEDPLKGLNDSDGTSLLVWLAYREAKEFFSRKGSH